MGTSSPVSTPENAWDAERLRDWIVANSRPLLITLSVVVVAGAGLAFWRQSVRLKNDRAEAAFVAAQGSFYSGNVALAKSDLEKLVTRYPGTGGGTQGSLLLAEILYGEGKHTDGIARLTAAQAGAPAQYAASIEEMIASGYADTGKPADAAAHLLKAAEKAQFPATRQQYRADAARMLMTAGKQAEAKAIWDELAAIPDSPVMTEARVRLGELNAKPATP